MTKICFGIPSWNRAAKLDRCVRAIAAQILETGIDASIFISDNCSSDNTGEVCRQLKNEFLFVEFIRLTDHLDAADNFESVYFNACGEYIWLFGDDDVLLAGGLERMHGALIEHSPVVAHAGCGLMRPHSNQTYRGTVLALTNKMGFNNFIGWMSSIVMKKDIAVAAAQLPEWKLYKSTAFWHVCGIIHIAHDELAIAVDWPIAEPMGEQDSEDLQRWAEGNTAWRYFLFIDALKKMYELGVLKYKLKPGFFKYLNFYLWDRFLVNMVSSNFSKSPFPEGGWERMLLIAEVIDDLDVAKKIRSNVMLAMGMCQTHRTLKEQVLLIEKSLSGLVTEINRPVLPLSAFGGAKAQ